MNNPIVVMSNYIYSCSYECYVIFILYNKPLVLHHILIVFDCYIDIQKNEIFPDCSFSQFPPFSFRGYMSYMSLNLYVSIILFIVVSIISVINPSLVFHH